MLYAFMASLRVNQQRREETLACQKKDLGKKLDDFDLSKLKGWGHRRNVKDFQVFW